VIFRLLHRFASLFSSPLPASLWRRRCSDAFFASNAFGVVSNNCWGPNIHQTAGIAYITPFVGLFFTPESYLNLLANWGLVRARLEFKEKSSEDRVEKVRRECGTLWPVGVLAGQVEIQFMHYKNRDEARTKWERRLKRMPVDIERLFVKFDDYDGVSADQVSWFAALDFPNEVFFTASEDFIGAGCAVHIATRTGKLPDGVALSRISPQYFDSASWIGGQRQPRSKLLSFV